MQLPRKDGGWLCLNWPTVAVHVSRFKMVRQILFLSYAVFVCGSYKSLVYDGDVNDVSDADKSHADALPPLTPHKILPKKLFTQSRKTVSMNDLLMQIQDGDKAKHSKSVSSSPYESESSDDSQVYDESKKRETSEDEKSDSSDDNDDISMAAKGILKKKTSSQENVAKYSTFVPKENLLEQSKEDDGYNEADGDDEDDEDDEDDYSSSSSSASLFSNQTMLFSTLLTKALLIYFWILVIGKISCIVDSSTEWGETMIDMMGTFLTCCTNTWERCGEAIGNYFAKTDDMMCYNNMIVDKLSYFFSL